MAPFTRQIARILVWAAALWVAGVVSHPGLRLLGQDSPDAAPSKVERKNKAPVSQNVLRVRLPKPFEAKLKNGLTLLIVEDHRAPFISLQLHINGAGALFEPASMAGLANATAQMLREGTRSRSSVEIAKEIDRLGASIGAGSSFGSPDIVLSASGLSDNFDTWLDVTVDMLLNANFPADELEKLKQRERSHLRQQRSSANFLASERFNRAVYDDHPAAIVSPTRESIAALTRAALVKWHEERFTPQNSVLGIAGDVRAKELIPKLEKKFAAWKGNQTDERWPANPVAAKERRVFLVDRPSSVQTTVALGNIAIDRRDPNYMAMEVMNYVLGGGVSGRLFLNLREEKGYSYGVYSHFSALWYPGPWRAGGNVRTEVTEPALHEFFYEIRRIRSEKVSPEELQASKHAIVASFALSLERPSRVLSFAMTRWQFKLPADYWDTYPAKIMAVTADDVQRVAEKYLDPDAMQLVAVGDASRIKAALEKYGTVAVFDPQGRLLPSTAP